MKLITPIVLLWILVSTNLYAGAQESSDAAVASPPVTAALIGVAEKGEPVKGMGEQVNALLFALLSTNNDLMLVEREKFDVSGDRVRIHEDRLLPRSDTDSGATTVVDELQLSLSGMVDPTTAAQIGRLTGAKILISGTVLQIDEKLYLIFKLIGTETTRVLGVSAKGPIEEGLTPLVEKLATEIGTTLGKRSGELIATPKANEDLIAVLRSKIGTTKMPTVIIDIREKHVGDLTTEPAATTELTRILNELGFTILDPEARNAKADYRITGEGTTEFGLRRRNLFAVKARLEIRMVDTKTKQVVFADQQTVKGVDLSERIASKNALQEATIKITERMVPSIAKTWSQR